MSALVYAEKKNCCTHGDREEVWDKADYVKSEWGPDPAVHNHKCVINPITNKEVVLVPKKLGSVIMQARSGEVNGGLRVFGSA